MSEQEINKKLDAMTDEEIDTLYYLLKLGLISDADDMPDCGGCTGEKGCC